MKIFKLLGKIILGILALVFLVLLGTTIWNQILTGQETREYADFGQRISVDGKTMNTLVLGEGDPTIVMLSGMGTLSPIVDFKPLAQKLSNSNRVVILEFFGYGFSDDTDVPRTNQNISSEIHQALQALNVDTPCILMGHSISGIYTLDYAQRYPEEVAGIVGIDPSVPQQIVTDMQLSEATRISSDITDIIGLTRIVLTPDYALFKEMKASGNYTNEDITPARAACIRKSVSKADLSEINQIGQNLNELKDIGYPTTLPVLNFISSDSVAQYQEHKQADQSGWLELHEEMITDTTIQKNVVLDGAHYLHWTQLDEIALQTSQFAEDLSD